MTTVGGVRRRRLFIAAQLVVGALVLGFLGYAFRDAWREAAPRLRDADLVDFGIALAIIAVYYLLFVVGWRWILETLRVRVSYNLALQAEMASMLAKYIPGAVWTPAARVLWLRRAGIKDTPLVLSSVLLEAGLSAVAGVFVFLLGLTMVGSVDVPLAPLLGFAAAIAVVLHPRVFRWIAVRVFRPFGGVVIPEFPFRVLAGLFAYYSFTWLVGGAGLLFLLRSVGGEPELTAIPFLGGTAAVGAIVAVLSVFAPSGLGVREASMYGLVLALVPSGVALGAVVLNRVAITIVEAALLLLGLAAWRLGGRRSPSEQPAERLEGGLLGSVRAQEAEVREPG
jgi:glycosyltransferase 2 family protein